MTKSTKTPQKKSSKATTAKTKKAKVVVKKQNLASTALVLALVNALFSVLFIAIVAILYRILPDQTGSMTEVVAWILLAINVVVAPFIAATAIIFAIASISRKSNRIQAITAICIVLVSALMFVATWGMSIS